MSKHIKLMWVSVFILLIGAYLRLIFMHVHGFDVDEMFTIGFARQPLSFLLGDFANTQYDVHPKLYYLFLHFWLSPAGSSEIGARFPGLLADLILGAALIQVARMVSGQRAGLVVAVLWCLNPLLIWNTAQVRMYGLLAMWTALAWLFLIKALLKPHVKWWFVFSLATLAAAYTHVLGGIVVAGAGVTSGLWSLFRRRLAGVIAMSAVAGAYLPYFISLWAVRSIEKSLITTIPRKPLVFAPFFVASLLANRLSLSMLMTWVLALGCLLLLGLSWRVGRKAIAGTLTFITLITSLGAGYFALSESVFSTKYIAFILPAFLVGLAGGLSSLHWRVLRGTLLMGLLAASAAGLRYQMAPSITDDFPSAARFIEAHGDDGDVLIVMTNYAEPAFRYYYEGESVIAAPWHTIPSDVPTRDIERLLEEHDTAWLILYATNTADPNNTLDRWFRVRYPVRAEAFPANVTIRAYDLRPMTPVLPPETAKLDVAFEGRVALRGYQVYQQTVSAQDEHLHPPSGWVHISLYWEALETGVAFEARLQVENEMSELYGAAFTRGTETFVMYPTTTWQRGQIWRTDYDINLNPATPSGEYKVVIRVFSPGDSRPWTIDEEGTSWVILDRVTIDR